ncbi:MAG: rhodanese-like domain-containing protein [Ignavibacteriaceae bacterium]|jgi:rhodanese-related sulfurtransferase|nr:rhodanese-like domain-containing protein [Ignavibacteriaceae bacterium]
MKEQKIYFLFYFFIAITFAFINIGCSDDKDDPITPPKTINESEELVKYLEGTDGGYINNAAPAVIAASAVNTDILLNADITIIDVRSASDFAAGHIQGAVNVEIKDVVTYYKNNNLSSKSKVVVACYTGQSAGLAVAALRLSGFTNVFSLKWGMCSWAYPTSWNSAKTYGMTNPITKQTTANAKNPAGNLPTLSTGKNTGAEIFESRLNTVLNEGFTQIGITRETIYANLNNYYIVNYWPVAEYDQGHIEGAIQYTPKTDLKLAQFLKTLPTNKTIVVYCYTGQTSAQVATFLRILGYDAKSLQFGANRLFYDTMPGSKWDEATEFMDYPVVQ